MHKPTLLYAEDDAETRENYAFVLKKFFDTIYTAGDGEEALAIYREKKPDILLLDISMPLLDGLSLAAEVRKTDKETPMVILSAYSDQSRLLKAIPLGFTEYLLKPVDDRVLRDTMQKLIAALKSTRGTALKASSVWYREDAELFCREKQISLTKKETELMTILAGSVGHHVPKERLIMEIWEDETDSESSEKRLIQLVYRLNKKITLETGYEGYFIENSYALGYKLLPA